MRANPIDTPKRSDYINQKLSRNDFNPIKPSFINRSNTPNLIEPKNHSREFLCNITIHKSSGKHEEF